MHRIDHPHHPISQTTAHLSVFTIFFISTTCPPYTQLPSSIIPFSPAYRQSPKLSTVTVHAYVPSNGICRGFAFKYGKFLLPPRFLTALSVPKVPTREQKRIRIASERKKILRKTRYLGMMYICAHSREEESCRKRPRSARECARAHSLFYGRRGDGCFLSVASVLA